ncbi:MAG: MMPL family transporter [Thermoanaerobaculia bacterium]
MLDRVTDTIANICLHHTRRILVASAVLALAALAGASLLSFDPDILNLIPQHNHEVNDFRKVLTEMGTIDYHIVVMQIPGGHDVHEYDSLIENIARGYESSPLINDVVYRIPNPLEMIEELLPRSMLLLTPSELREVAGKLTDEQIRETVARDREILRTPQSFAMKEVIRYDPFNLLPIYLRRFKSAGNGFRLDVTSGYYLSEDHSTLLILTKPKRPAQDIPFARKLVAAKAEIEKKAVDAFRKSAGSGTPVPTIQYTGGYMIAFGDAELIKKDIVVNVLFSFFGVLALFLYAFRRAASIAYAGIPMALGLAMTFGIAGAVYGILSSASAGFAALLAGLGIDFITVMYGRYVDERNRGVGLDDAIRIVMRKTLPGVFIAAITTSATFYAFLATDFRGMRQLGFLTGTGILFFLLAVTFLLPALVIRSERKSSGNGKDPRLFLHSFGSHHVIDWSIANPRKTIAFWSIFVILAGVAATKIRFSDNIQDLRAKGNQGVEVQEQLTKKFGQSFDFMMYVVEGKSMDSTLERTQASSADLEQLVQNGTIASYQSIGSLLPTTAQQNQVIRMLHEGRDDTFSFDRISQTFRAALAANGFRPGGWDHYLDLFHQALDPKGPITLESIDDANIQRLASRFVKKTPDGFMSVTYVYPTGGVWERDVPPALLALQDRHPGSILTGVNLVSGTLRRIVRADAIRATLIGFIAVFLLMFLSFRTVKMTIMTFVPFIAGATGMLGLMAALDLEFNFMNVFVGLMIIGVATDYAVYMLERFLENRDHFARGASETGKAVVMAAITSIVGYGSFALSHYPGLRSIGYASTFGILLSGLAAITLVPAVLVLEKKRAGVTSERTEMA